jgi:hypothetical protein
MCRRLGVDTGKRILVGAKILEDVEIGDRVSKGNGEDEGVCQ